MTAIALFTPQPAYIPTKYRLAMEIQGAPGDWRKLGALASCAERGVFDEYEDAKVHVEHAQLARLLRRAGADALADRVDKGEFRNNSDDAQAWMAEFCRRGDVVLATYALVTEGEDTHETRSSNSRDVDHHIYDLAGQRWAALCGGADSDQPDDPLCRFAA